MTPLITGANRGIGAVLMRHYAERGDTPIGTSRAGGDLEPLDVTDPNSTQAMGQRLSGQKIDLLICNAGVYLDGGQTLDGYPAEMWAQGFAANVTGVFLTIQAMLPNIRAAGGKIAIISSQMASHNRAPGGSYVYRASKAAALNLGRNLATDLRPEGIPVGIYHPGWVKTDMGGSSADITADESAAGLIARFDALGMQNTGCFETWDGRDHPF